MKTYAIVILVAALGLLVGGAWLIGTAKEPPQTPTGFALVELFTSEGCSSCPPADEVLSELVREHATQGNRVYCLSFHVDYWNNLGWTDPFSAMSYSERQRAYAAARSAPNVYTPQVVINGEKGLVGSNRDAVREVVDTALKSPAGQTVSITVVAEGTERAPPLRRYRVRYKVTGNPDASQLQLAVVESGLSSRVTRGENDGKTLGHANVVRSLTTVALDSDGEGETVLDLTKEIELNRSKLIAFVQNRQTPHVTAATESGF